MQFAFSVFFEIKFSILSNFDFAHRGERVIAAGRDIKHITCISTTERKLYRLMPVSYPL